VKAAHEVLLNVVWQGRQNLAVHCSCCFSQGAFFYEPFSACVSLGDRVFPRAALRRLSFIEDASCT
jgi:hypothetical protein